MRIPLYIILSTICVGFIFTTIYLGIMHELNKEVIETDCYDKFSNKIIGEVCEIETSKYKELSYFFIIFSLISFFSAGLEYLTESFNR